VNRLVVGLLVLTVVVQMLILYRQQNAPPQLPTRSAVEAIADRSLKVSVDRAPKLGKSGAKVALIEFADFECPFCRKHASTVLPLLKEKFIETGVAAYYYVHLPLTIHRHATDAAKAAECANDQGRFWEMHDLLFKISEPTSLVPEEIRKLAASLQIDLKTFDACLGTVAERIESDVVQANQLGIRATPAFILGTVADDGTIALSTRINGAQPLEVFVKAIEALQQRRSE
jgi:protein-disulfide isomerase